MSQTTTSLPSAIHSGGTPKARYAFIQSSWHEDIVDQGRGAFLAEMARQGVALNP